MNYEWLYYQENEGYLFKLEGVPMAYLYFIGGHVERPDAWYVNLKGDTSSSNGFSSLGDAKKFVEEYYESIFG